MTKKKKVKRVSVSINKPELVNADSPADMTKIESKLKKLNDKCELKPFLLISKLNMPEYVKYDGEDLVVSPRSKMKMKNIDLLDMPLKQGLIVKKLK